MKSVREGTEKIIDQNLIVKHDWDASWNPNYALNKAFADLVMSRNGLITEELDSKRIEDRRYHFDLLLRWLPLLWCSQGALVHYCPLGCCQSRADSVQKIYGAFHAALLSYRPKVPALSRWLGVFQPLAWWVTAFTFHGIGPLVSVSYTHLTLPTILLV